MPDDVTTNGPPLDALSSDANARLRRRMQPDWLEPTLATLVHEPFSDPNWLFEPKLDGERCLIFQLDGRVKLYTRNRKRLNETYPEIARAIAEQSDQDLILDGEIVAFDGDKTSFARLQQRMQREDADAGRGSPIPVYCYLFDVAHLAGYDVTELQLRDRKKLLARMAEFRDPLRLTPYENADGEDYYRRACAAGQEGALAKDATSRYAHGRSRSWLKFKCVANQELVIGGYTEPTGSRTGLGALLVGYYESGNFVYAGKVGTGFDEKTLRDLRQRLSDLERNQSPFTGDTGQRHAHWAEPELVANIAFTEWTQDGKLRHPSFQGLRSDKNPNDVMREVR